MHLRKIVMATVLLFLLCSSFLLAQGTSSQTPQKEEIVLSTYYPVPYGDYRELRSRRMAIGNTYADYSNVCWEQGKCTNYINEAINGDTDLVVEGNVGIGMYNPQVKLGIAQNGAVQVGQAYLSSGGDYAHLANNEWLNGTAWQSNGAPGALIQTTGQHINFYRHDGQGNHYWSGGFSPSGDFTVTGNAVVNGRISVGGIDFCPQRLVRCWLPWMGDHMTWVDNESECNGAAGIVEGVFYFLGQC